MVTLMRIRSVCHAGLTRDVQRVPPREGRPRCRWAGVQKELTDAGVLGPETKMFIKDRVFENWTRAARCVSGIDTYSGAYHWQRLEP